MLMSLVVYWYQVWWYFWPSRPLVFIENSPEYERFMYCYFLRSFIPTQDFPDDHLGRVYYNLYYDEIDEALNVYIQRIRNLPKSTPQAGKTNKTYIK